LPSPRECAHTLQIDAQPIGCFTYGEALPKHCVKYSDNTTLPATRGRVARGSRFPFYACGRFG
jgi:hypothetical protein